MSAAMISMDIFLNMASGLGFVNQAGQARSAADADGRGLGRAGFRGVSKQGKMRREVLRAARNCLKLARLTN
jgi:hypothetical protein